MGEFLKDRWNSIFYAFKGVWILLKSENAFRAQGFFFVIFILLGIYFEISQLEWIAQFFCMGLIWSIEGLNTAVEKLCDFVHPEHQPRIGMIKDIAAGAVAFAVVFSLIIFGLIYLPYLF